MSRFTHDTKARGTIGLFWLPVLLLLIPGACQGGEETAAPCPSGVHETLVATRVPGELVAVPAGRTPTIDGRLSPEEWDCARLELFTDGSRLFLMHDDDYLYLAIQADRPEMIVSNVHLEQGDEIAVLHASAALGTAVYELGEHGWEQLQGYDWCCRGGLDEADDQAERQAFLESDGWVATNSRFGEPNEMEYQIALPDAPARLAVVFMRLSEPEARVAWPAGLADDCIEPQSGGFADHAHFSPETWVPIELLPAVE